MTAELRKWSVRHDPYTTPETRSSGLNGLCYGDDRFPDGSPIELGRVASVDGDVMELKYDGSKFRLVDPDPEYLAWLKERGIPFDPEHPFKLKEE